MLPHPFKQYSIQKLTFSRFGIMAGIALSVGLVLGALSLFALKQADAAGLEPTPFGKPILPASPQSVTGGQDNLDLNPNGKIALAYGNRITRKDIYLSDIFTNLPAGLDQQVMVSPEPGGEIRLNSYQLKEIARRFHVNWQPIGQLNNELVLARPGKIVAKQDIINLVQSVVMRQYNQTSDTGEFMVRLDNLNDGLHLPETATNQATIQNLTLNQIDGSFSASLVIASLQSDPLVINLSGIAVPMVIAFTPIRTIERGELIRKQDFQTMMIASDQAKDLLIGTIGSDYQEAKVTLQVGKPLRSRDIQPAQLVKRGEQVILELHNGSLHLTVNAKALESGESGQVIRVKNETSQVILDAEIIGPGRARLGPRSPNDGNLVLKKG